MVLKFISKVILFFNSYTFFFVITIFKILGNTNITPIRGFIIIMVFLLVIIISLIFTLILISHAKSNVDTFVEIKEYKEENVNLLGYIFSYIVPFIGLDLSNNYEIIIITILILIIGYYYIKSNLFYLNPTLNLFGYRISKILSENDKVLIIIYKKEDLYVNSIIKAKNIAGNIFLGRKINGDK